MNKNIGLSKMENKVFLVTEDAVLYMTNTDGKLNNQGIIDIDIFVESMQIPRALQTPILPKNCIKYSVQDKMYTFIFEYEKTEEIVLSVQRQPTKLPMPWTYFLVSIKETSLGYKFGKTAIASSNNRVNKEGDLKRLGVFPYGNRTPSTGDVCWGNSGLRYNSRKTITENAFSAFKVFFSSGFNFDFDWYIGSNCTRHMEYVPDLIKKAADKLVYEGITVDFERYCS